MKWDEIGDQPCSVARTLSVLGDRWTMLILRNAFMGIRRFDEFQRSLGVTRHVLSERLKRLVEYGILTKVPYVERRRPDNSYFQNHRPFASFPQHQKRPYIVRNYATKKGQSIARRPRCQQYGVVLNLCPSVLFYTLQLPNHFVKQQDLPFTFNSNWNQSVSGIPYSTGQRSRRPRCRQDCRR